VGCATAPPKVQNEKKSAIAISVFMNNFSIGTGAKSLGEENVRFDYIFFIQLNNLDDSLLKRELFVSNYVYESLKASFQFDAVDSFFLNVDPGIYAAVGAVGTGRNSQEKFIIYFPKDMIESTIRKVQPNTVTYMGKYILNKLASLDIFGFKRKQLKIGSNETSNNDPQIFYSENYAFDFLKLEDGKTVISKYNHPVVVLSSLNKSLCSEHDEYIFLNNHLKTFAETNWVSKIKNRLSMIEELDR
jgi:hypothetical protein